MISKTIEKKYGIGVFIDADSILEEKTVIVPTTPILDVGLLGGIPEGCLAIVSGPEKSGKTTLCLQIARNGQQPQHGNKHIFYIDVEARIRTNKKVLKAIPGLDLSKEKFTIISSVEGNILSAEQIINLLADLIKEHPRAIFILDSSSALCMQKEMDEEITASGRHQGPKLLAAFCRQMAPIVQAQRSILLVIQHLITNTSGYGVPFMEDGGKYIKYQCDTKIRCVGVQDWKVGSGDNGEQIGQKVKWDIIHSALGKPVGKPECYIRYGYGYDEVWEYIQLGLEIGLLKLSGSWITIEFLEDKPKVQGQEKCRQYLLDNPEQLKLLISKVKEALL